MGPFASVRAPRRLSGSCHSDRSGTLQRAMPTAAPRRAALPKKRGPKPRPIVEFPQPLNVDWSDPPSFSEAFTLQLQRHGDSCWHLHRALLRPGETFGRKTFQQWAAGTKQPNTIMSFEMRAPSADIVCRAATSAARRIDSVEVAWCLPEPCQRTRSTAARIAPDLSGRMQVHPIHKINLMHPSASIWT